METAEEDEPEQEEEEVDGTELMSSMRVWSSLGGRGAPLLYDGAAGDVRVAICLGARREYQ